MQTIVNLGLAGGGYAGHKLGLLRTDQLPDLLEGSVGTSDWWVKNTPLEDDKTVAYTSGRLAANILPAILSLAGFGKPIPSRHRPGGSEVGALYRGGDKDLVVTHSVPYPEELGRWPKKSAEPDFHELINPSWAVERGGVYTTDRAYGKTKIVPRPEKLEPRISPTRIKNRDFYSPRWIDAVGQRADVALAESGGSKRRAPLLPESARDMGIADQKNDSLRAEAIGRLIDRFGEPYARGGVMDETGGNAFGVRLMHAPGEETQKERLRRLLLLGKGKGFPSYDTAPGAVPTHSSRLYKMFQEGADDISYRDMFMLESPDFPSWKAYEQSSKGGRALLTSTPNATERVTRSASALFLKEQELLSAFRKKADPALAADMTNPRRVAIEILQGKGDWTRGEKELAASFLQSLRKLPADYAEAKTYGPFSLNPDNVAGIVTPRGAPGTDFLKYTGTRKGIPVIEINSPEDSFEAIRDLQSFRPRGTR
jgi:hypothetical protein